jgi:site-specific recombinase XerD
MKPSRDVATLIERYFTERLIRQRNVSANTIASYRIRSGCCSRLHRRGSTSLPRTWPSTISMYLLSARSSPISRRSAAPAPGPATCV